jgi:hypothetical protein
MEAPNQRSNTGRYPWLCFDTASVNDSSGSLWEANSETGHEAGFFVLLLRKFFHIF